jgi:hypothetical protein
VRSHADGTGRPYVQIIEDYRRQIAAGKLKDGDMRPAGREIAAEFDRHCGQGCYRLAGPGAGDTTAGCRDHGHRASPADQSCSWRPDCHHSRRTQPGPGRGQIQADQQDRAPVGHSRIVAFAVGLAVDRVADAWIAVPSASVDVVAVDG